ncbi:MAG: ABC transporter ATP-binding protein [Balneolaceae bacterium]
MIHLQAHNLTRRYGSHTVLKDLTFEARCPVLGIAGANGSGKSTLLKCIAGLLKPNRGTITWTVGGLQCVPSSLGSLVGYSAPYVELYEGMTVSENLEFLRGVNRNPAPENSAGFATLLERFHAAAYADKLYGELSTGQRQRIKLAAACIHHPPLLCLDEPGSNLDENGRKMLRRAIGELAGENRMVLIASNQPDELKMCHEIIQLDALFRQEI